MAKKLIIAMGLPASGKTTKLQEICKDCNFENRWREKDLFIDLDNKGQKNQLKEYCFNFNKYNKVIIDGLLLTNKDIIELFEVSKIDIDELEIHYFKPNIEKCLYNDLNRRSKSAEVTIRNSKLEYPNKDDLQKQLKEMLNKDIIININEYDIVLKSNAIKFIDDNNINYKEKILKSGTWSLGGSYGNCWDDELTYTSRDKPVEFEEFDEVLERICPNISFLQYKQIYKEFVVVKDYHVSDYYGGGETYAYYECDLEKLINKLVDMGLIESR